MFAKTIIDSDAFLDMPLSAQALYFHLSMRADDDGFINNPKKIQRMIGASDDDCKLLIMKQFIIPFESGIVVIKHWRIHNYIRSDRKKSTNYIEEMASLTEKENGEYSLICAADKCRTSVGQVSDKCQRSIGKNRLDKDSLELVKNSKDCEPQAATTPTRHKYGEYKNVLLSDVDMEKLKSEFPDDYKTRIERLSEYIASTGKVYKNHLATIRCWARKEKDKPQIAVKGKNTNSDNITDFDRQFGIVL